MLKKNKVWLATGNHHKIKEAREVLKEFGVVLEHLPTERIEIQADNSEKIAIYSLKQLPYDGRLIAVEDAGLYLEHYGGFPGPYSSYALEKINLTGMLRLMEGISNRRAAYHSVVALQHDGDIKVFKGTVEGRISEEIRGIRGFGYDPIFIPDECDGRTFGETFDKEKKVSRCLL